MSLGKKTIRMVKKVLKDPEKRAMYSPQELAYMEIQLERMEATRKARKAARKQQKGFSNE